MSARRHRNDDYGMGYDLAGALVDGPKSLDQLRDHYMGYLRFLGLYSLSAAADDAQGREHVDETIRTNIEGLLSKGWIVRSDESRFALTDKGRPEAEKMLRDMRRTASWLATASAPETVSKVTLVVHLLLAAVKLPAALLSGSVGLLNDGIDTALDALSSLMVYAGLRWERERLTNIVLVLVMLITGGVTLFEGISRLLHPVPPQADWLAFAAALISAGLCALLFLYQRWTGLRSGALSLITQSVDSRNHIIVAGSVIAGLIASLLYFPLLDTLVGLAVALLIVKSAVELAIEAWRAMGEEELDLSGYSIPLVNRYERLQRNQLRDWILYLVANGRATTPEQIQAQVQAASDFRAHTVLRELGFAGPLDVSPTGAQQTGVDAAAVQEVVDELIAEGLISDGPAFAVTPEGRDRVRQATRQAVGRRHWRQEADSEKGRLAHGVRRGQGHGRRGGRHSRD